LRYAPAECVAKLAIALLPESVMTKKWKLIMLAVAAVGLVAGPLLYLFSLPKTQLRANYNRVHRGMTVEEVHEIMGQPGITGFSNGLAQGEAYSVEVDPESYSFEVATVWFVNGRVTGKSYRQNNRVANGLEEIRERLGF
jgi:hypothetical protein